MEAVTAAPNRLTSWFVDVASVHEFSREFWVIELFSSYCLSLVKSLLSALSTRLGILHSLSLDAVMQAVHWAC